MLHASHCKRLLVVDCVSYTLKGHAHSISRDSSSDRGSSSGRYDFEFCDGWLVAGGIRCRLSSSIRLAIQQCRPVTGGRSSFLLVAISLPALADRAAEQASVF